MTSIPELGATLNVPIEEVIRMGETQVRNPDSAIFKTILSSVVQKLGAMRNSSEANVSKRGGKTRVYIQHHVPTKYRFSMISAYPQFDIHWNTVDVRSGAVNIAAGILACEYMFAKFQVKQGSIVAFGASLKQLVLRNRSWVHLCIAGHTVRAQAEFHRDDRSIAAITHSLTSAGKTGGLGAQYMSGAKRIHCTSATECNVQAKGGVLLLDKVDTNFRQVAEFMRQHGVELAYIALPACKAMEMCVASPFEELDAYVFPSDGGERINISYKNAASQDMSYTYSNYLELVARTSVVLDGVTYHKEFDNRLHGYNFYKITRLSATFDEQPPPYKSWIEPGYESKYLAYLPVLKDGGSVSRPQDWTLVGHPVDRSIVDDVVDFAMRAQGVEMVSQRIEQRMNTRTSNYSLVNTVVSDVSSVPVHMFDSLCLAIYCGIFMRKFEDGKTVATLAPHARQVARLAKAGSFQVTQAYAGMLVSNMVRASSVVSDAVRSAFYSAVGEADLPTPTFAVCPGYVEYSDRGSSNPRFRGWSVPEHTANYGFSTHLPGVSRDEILHGVIYASEADTTMSIQPDVVQSLIASGEAYVDESGSVQAMQHASVVEIAAGLTRSFASLFTEQPDIDDIVNSEAFKITPMLVDNKSHAVADGGPGLFSLVPQKEQKWTKTDSVNKLADRVVDESGGFVDIMPEKLTENRFAFTPGLPEFIPGYYASDPKEYLRSAIVKIFPNSLVMNTSQFESDRVYGSWETLSKAIKVKLDVSKISGVKPESYYPPLLRGHVHPNVRNNFSTTWHSVNTRNLNTAVNADPMDTKFLWDRSWRAALKVFYVEGAEEKLKAMPYIGPSEGAVHEWASKLEDAKRNKLANVEQGYSFVEMMSGATNTHLMVKGKLKPTLDASYADSVKYPQTIQYDATGKSVAVFSPIIAQKVSREQSILKPNVLVLQGKSHEDINVFLNGFDWRPNEKGVRRYIEIDYSKYDKSQGARLAEMYLMRLATFGVLPEFIKFIKDNQHERTVSSMTAGIKAWLKDQNESGAAFTLDRNNDINELVIAELLLPILHLIEFIILMGDDIIIAIRGEVDVAHWEVDLSRKYNLTLKAAVHEHGYICSMDIVHMPDGHTLVVADVVKRALAFMDQSTKDEDKFKERFISYADGLRNVDDLRVQTYLSAALPKRMTSYLSGTDSDAIMCLVKAHARLRKDYKAYRSMFAEESKLRTY